MFGSHLDGPERRARIKQITTAYDMGASLDFWKEDNPEAIVTTLRDDPGVLVGGRMFGLESYRSELAESAAWMAERAPSMRAFLAQEDPRLWGRRKRRRKKSRPEMTLKSYVLQEAEAVGREAKITAAPLLGLRVVGLQHDGVAVLGVKDETEVAERMSSAITAASGYVARATVERVRHPMVVD